MGNALRCLEGGVGAGDDEHYPYYRPTSNIGLQGRATTDSSPPPPLTNHRRVLAHHDATAAVAALDHQYILDFKRTSMPAPPKKFRELQGNFDVVPGNTVVLPQDTRKTYQDQYIDESSAEGLQHAETYARCHPMLVEVQVLGTSGGRTFWRMSDDATRISRKLALILRSHHAAGKYLVAPLQLSSVWIGCSSAAGTGAGSSVVVVKLRGVRFSGKQRGFRPKRVRDDYRDLARVLQALVRVSGGDVAKLPPDYREFLALLVSDDTMTTTEDEFFIVNHPALLPMSNRTEAFLVLHDRIVRTLDRTAAGKKKKKILARLPYEQDWLDTARANKEINRYITGGGGFQVQKPYKRTQLDQLRLNRNVRSHLNQYNNEDIEQVLYCEWPRLLMEMARLLHEEGELHNTGIHTKFG